MKEQFSKLDRKLYSGIESQAVVALEAQTTLSKLEYQAQTQQAETQKQTRLMGEYQTEMTIALAMQSQRITDSLHGQDMLATKHHIQAASDLREHQVWLQSTLGKQQQLAIRQYDEILDAVKRVVPVSTTPPDDDLREYEENVSFFFYFPTAAHKYE